MFSSSSTPAFSCPESPPLLLLASLSSVSPILLQRTPTTSSTPALSSCRSQPHPRVESVSCSSLGALHLDSRASNEGPHKGSYNHGVKAPTIEIYIIYISKSAFPPELVDNPDDSKHNQEAGGSNRTTDGIVLNIMIKRASTV